MHMCAHTNAVQENKISRCAHKASHIVSTQDLRRSIYFFFPFVFFVFFALLVTGRLEEGSSPTSGNAIATDFALANADGSTYSLELNLEYDFRLESEGVRPRG